LVGGDDTVGPREEAEPFSAGAGIVQQNEGGVRGHGLSWPPFCLGTIAPASGAPWRPQKGAITAHLDRKPKTPIFPTMTVPIRGAIIDISPGCPQGTGKAVKGGLWHDTFAGFQ